VRFGDVALDAADGAILAHAVRFESNRPGSKLLKKGVRLGPSELDLLRAAGVESVTVAQLDAGDIEEDIAASIVAEAVRGPEITIGPASTGRANLFARAPGLADFDAAAVDALNRITEDVTLATLPRLVPVEAGRMVATVKIIPFAVPGEDIQLCAETGRRVALRVAPFRPMAARLIHTVNPGLKESVIAKTSAVTADRLARLGGTLAGETRCAHDVGSLTEAIARATEDGCDILLVIGASAIVDRRDVIPAAIAALGGRIERLGMPVDPGNLILLAAIGDMPVLGLPGCARSPARNGLDWVLERIAAGIPVGRAEIAAMGVGGLLVGREEEKDYF
jgi:molybdenum cofactor cytidylyltransferase